MLINEQIKKKNITKYRLSKEIGVLQDIINEYRSDFETFKSNVCHYVKDMGDLDFIVYVLEKDEIGTLYRKKWYPEALYLLAMLDYLSRLNDIELCSKYNDIRKCKLEKPIYPVGLVMNSEVLESEELLVDATKKAIPEFYRFNIIEYDIRNVI